MLYSEYEDKNGVNGNEVILWIVSNQLSRRNLTSFQRSELVLRLKPKMAQEAKDRKELNLKQNTEKDKLPYREAGGKQVRDQLGEIAGVSGKTIDRVETILNKGTKEDIQSFTKLLVSGGKSE